MFRARGCTHEEAADLAQEAAVRAYVHIRRWGVTGPGLDPLLNRIARNLLIDRYRRTTPHIVPLDDAGELSDPDQDLTEEVVRRQRSHAVRSAIRGLPDRHRDAITYSLNGLTPEEVGSRMGIGRNAADALLHRARRSLKERLKTVGESMMGVAIGVRLRWDRMVGRAEGSGAEAGLAAASSVGVSLATAAVLAVMTVTSAGGSPPGGPRVWNAPAVAQAIYGDTPDAAPAPPATSTTDVFSAAGSSGGKPGSTTYTFGPTQTTTSPDRVDQSIAVRDPSDPSGPALLEIDHGVYREEAEELDEGLFCRAFTRLCRAVGSLGA